MQRSLLASLEALAAKRGLPDPAVILAVQEDKTRRQRIRSKPWWLRVIDGERQDSE